MMQPTIRCPFCFTDIHARPETLFSCEGNCEAQITTNPYGTPKVKRILRADAPAADGSRPTTLTCRFCHTDTSTQVCPQCLFVLPQGWRSAYTTCVAMAGPRASGKSFYIAVMRRQLERIFEQQGRPFVCIDQATAEFFQTRYEDPIFEQRNLLESTRPLSHGAHEQKPLIFTAGFVGPYPHNLVIRDVAGEDLESADPLPSPGFDFLANADALVFMVDPMKVEGIRIMLEGLVPQNERIGADPRAVLARLLAKVNEPPVRARRPALCLVLSKFDVLQELRDVEGADWSAIMRNQGAAFLRDPSLNSPAYDDADGRLLHEEARSLLTRLGAAGLIHQINAAGLDVRMFTVSSLGQHSEGDKIHARGISPFRCADPLKWVLSRAQVLTTTSAAAP